LCGFDFLCSSRRENTVAKAEGLSDLSESFKTSIFSPRIVLKNLIDSPVRALQKFVTSQIKEKTSSSLVCHGIDAALLQKEV
jgi:hypothetical protein